MASASTEVESTRVFVSGLPPSLTTNQLAAHFRNQYKVTDAHVFPERRIGFVGFHDPETAQNAVKYFNRSYIRMSKISVDLAKPVEVRHSRSGHAVPVSQRDSHVGASKRQNEPENSLNETGRTSIPTDATVDLSLRKRKREAQDDGEQDRAQSNPGVPVETSQTAEETFLSSAAVEPINSDMQANPGPPQTASDSDWLRGRTSRLLDLVGPEDAGKSRTATDVEEQRKTDTIFQDDDIEEMNEDLPDKPEADHIAKFQEKVPNARLFIRNLAFDVVEDDLTKRFREFGKVQEESGADDAQVHVSRDPRTSNSKGMAFVQFSNNEAAETALHSMDGVAFHGRLLHILPASDKREQGLTEFDISKMPLKKQKAIRRKAEANTASFSWNSLYMNPDAVISSIAQRLGVAKSEILDPTSADAAVKQAHAETQVISETKEYFRSHGVDVDALRNVKRDDRSLLLKNFPFGTTESELKELLEPHGQISRFMLPPAGTMAIVQFIESFSAAQAMKSLAYKNVKGSVLYLEKAPQGLLIDSIAQEKPKHEHTDSVTTATAGIASPGLTSTVFVRNLNFSTTTPRLSEAFSSLSGFLSARVKTRTDPKRPGEILSMGFGFVEFRTKAHAEAAIAAMDNHVLDAHKLLVKVSTKKTDVAEERRKDDNARKNGANGTKILIKNLPFQASAKDVRSLFAQYGQLKKVRVPKKFDNSSRGFGFAEFVTAKEAENAMESLSNTHLLGRRLVLDFAQEETVDPEAEINAVERKMEQQSNRFNISKLTGSGRKKFNVDDNTQEG